MFKFIEGLPPDVLAIEASGKVTNDDYRHTLAPRAEAMLVKGPLRMLYVVGGDFTGFELEALWDDSALGFQHWHEFRRGDRSRLDARIDKHVQTFLSRRGPAVQARRIAGRERLDPGPRRQGVSVPAFANPRSYSLRRTKGLSWHR